MPSLIATAVQSSCLKVAANLTAQLAARWNAKGPQPLLDVQRLIEFATYGFVGASMNYVFQNWLERSLPTHGQVVAVNKLPVSADDIKPEVPVPAVTDGSHSNRINWRNVVFKVVLDQTVGFFVLLAVFLFITNVGRVPNLGFILEVWRQKIWGLLKAGWTIWPAVAVINFLWVPVRSRVLVGACVGFGWNIFLSIFSMAR
ncbi:Mpv17/PMP22 family protein [Xylariaceae sp. FL0662B]|nr:Mpv17/PMP22 family protein [Xylariaceae sp. FL0662B]